MNNSIGLRDLNGKFPSLEDIEDWFIDGVYNVATVVDKYRKPIFLGGVIALGVVTGGAALGLLAVPEGAFLASSGAFVGGVVGGSGNWIVSGQNWDHFINGFSGGMISGIGMQFGIGTAVVTGAVGSVLTTFEEEDELTTKKVLLSAIIGAISSAVGYGLSEKALSKSFYKKLIEGLGKNDKLIVKAIYEYLKNLYDVTLESTWNAISDLICDE